MSFSAFRNRINSAAACTLFVMLFILVLAACAEQSGNNSVPVPANTVISDPIILLPEASGSLAAENDKAVIDYSNMADGYVMVRYKQQTDKALKVQLKCSLDTYTFNLKPGEWETLPLGNGSDSYKVQVYENVEGNKYSAVLSAGFDAVLKDEFAPFLRPNQYVNYIDAPNTMKKGAELVAGHEDVLSKVGAVYDFVVKEFKYDKELAKTVQSGYLPVLDEVLEKKKGICFDYAAVMTAMLRSQGVPCKLVVGYAGDAYHAWISVWSDEEGWIEKAVYFDGKSWQRMDPTFASSSNAVNIDKYIGDGSNYREKYFY